MINSQYGITNASGMFPTYNTAGVSAAGAMPMPSVSKQLLVINPDSTGKKKGGGIAYR